MGVEQCKSWIYTVCSGLSARVLKIYMAFAFICLSQVMCMFLYAFRQKEIPEKKRWFHHDSRKAHE